MQEEAIKKMKEDFAQTSNLLKNNLENDMAHINTRLTSFLNEIQGIKNANSVLLVLLAKNGLINVDDLNSIAMKIGGATGEIIDKTVIDHAIERLKVYEKN